MPTDKETPLILCQDQLVRLTKNLALPDGTTVPKGTLVLLLPQTVAECVLTPEGGSLADVWESLSRAGHTHPEIAGFAEQLTRYADRLAVVETGIAELQAGFASMTASLFELNTEA